MGDTRVIQIKETTWINPSFLGGGRARWSTLDTSGERHWLFVDLEDYVLRPGQLLLLRKLSKPTEYDEWELEQIL